MKLFGGGNEMFSISVWAAGEAAVNQRGTVKVSVTYVLLGLHFNLGLMAL